MRTKIKQLEQQLTELRKENEILREGIELAYEYIQILENIARKYYRLEEEEELGFDEEGNFYDWYWTEYTRLKK